MTKIYNLEKKEPSQAELLEFYDHWLEAVQDEPCAREHKENNPHCYWSGFHYWLADEGGP